MKWLLYSGEIILIFVLVYLVSFFASSEIAFVSLNKIQLRQAVKENRKHARLINKMHGKMDRLLSTILVGTNLFTTFCSSLATTLAVSLMGQNGTIVATVCVTVLIIIFGEILPKTMAANMPYETAVKRAVLLRSFDILFFPITSIFAAGAKLLDKMMSFSHKNQKVITEEELKTLIDMGNQEGTLENSEKHILKNIVQFGDLRVRDIMRSKALMIAVNENASYTEILDTFAFSGHSHLPVYRENLDSIVGILSFKEMFDSNNFSMKKSMRSVCYVPETISALSVLRYMKKERQNIAIVVDEHGCNCGLITMDDILCSVFGRTMNAFNDGDASPFNRIQILKNNIFVVPGEIRLDDLNEALSLHLESEFFDTLGGWLLEQFGVLPSVGEVIKRNGIVYEIEDQAQRRIKSVRIILPNEQVRI